MTERKPTRWGFWCVVALLVVFVAYPLSYGPVICLIGKCGNPDLLTTIGGSVYLPLIWLSVNCDPVGKALRWYGSLFGF